MDDVTKQALEQDRTIDITTTGRKTGQLRRTEIWFHNLDGALYITGTPGPRDWYANLLGDPEFTFHLKESTQADLLAWATPILDEVTRRDVIPRIYDKLGRGDSDIEKRVARSPLVHVEFV